MTEKKNNSKPVLPSLFITGTDTGVGKTVLSALLGLIYQAADLKVAYFKPVETGARREENGLVPEDTKFVATVLGLEEPFDVLCPYCFEPPVSPHLAAHMAKKPIRREVITECFEYLQKFYDAVIVEGTGGLLVPLADSFLVADLASELALPLLITARPGLGTLNHTFLTIASAVQVNLKLAGVVLNRYPEDPDLAAKDNPKAISKFSGVPVLALVPEIPGLDLQEPRREPLAKEALKLNERYRLDQVFAKFAAREEDDVQP